MIILENKTETIWQIHTYQLVQITTPKFYWYSNDNQLRGDFYKLGTKLIHVATMAHNTRIEIATKYGALNALVNSEALVVHCSVVGSFFDEVRAESIMAVPTMITAECHEPIIRQLKWRKMRKRRKK